MRLWAASSERAMASARRRLTTFRGGYWGRRGAGIRSENEAGDSFGWGKTSFPKRVATLKSLT